MHKQSIACDPEDVLSLDFEVVDGLCCVLWLDAKHGGGTGKRGKGRFDHAAQTCRQRVLGVLAVTERFQQRFDNGG